jgi:hypothetical protein
VMGLASLHDSVGFCSSPAGEEKYSLATFLNAPSLFRGHRRDVRLVAPHDRGVDSVSTLDSFPARLSIPLKEYYGQCLDPRHLCWSPPRLLALCLPLASSSANTFASDCRLLPALFLAYLHLACGSLAAWSTYQGMQSASNQPTAFQQKGTGRRDSGGKKWFNRWAPNPALHIVSPPLSPPPLQQYFGFLTIEYSTLYKTRTSIPVARGSNLRVERFRCACGCRFAVCVCVCGSHCVRHGPDRVLQRIPSLVKQHGSFPRIRYGNNGTGR